MQTKKKNLLFLIPTALILLTSGCSISPKPVEVTVLPDFSQVPPSYAAARRFDEPTTTGPTAVDSAIELSRKYTKLSEEMTGLKQNNSDLIAENNRMKDQVALLDNQLDQTKKELVQATELLREMVVELNSWKADVIGFREEMRAAETTQLKALLDILKALGGEVTAATFQDEQALKLQPSAVENAEAPGPLAASTISYQTPLQQSVITGKQDE
ncbi:MAG: DUF3450 domain-containing protein [Planctomycetota bacterium]